MENLAPFEYQESVLIRLNVLIFGASWTFDVLKEWLKAEIKNGLPTLRSLGS